MGKAIGVHPIRDLYRLRVKNPQRELEYGRVKSFVSPKQGFWEDPWLTAAFC